MESIEIEGFLTISKAHFEIKKINILIGTQASGKSIVAKLVYFFKKFFSDIFIESIEKNQNKPSVSKHVLEKFEQLFPKYTWDHQEFIITYKYNNYQISISRKKTESNYSLKLDYCTELQSLHKSLKTLYNKSRKEYYKENADRKPSIEPQDSLYNALSNTDFENGFLYSIFIPASRSFFANHQKNVFSFLASNIDFDPFIKEFGSRYERSKRLFRIDYLPENKYLKTKINNLIELIISGKYEFSDDKDWIANHGKRTNLANASSGQQESLPMLIILSIWPFLYGNDRKGMFFIEEPEAHLFPMSQKQIISILATISNAFGHPFFITTHSPYILTAINNLVIGCDAYDNCHNDEDRLQLSKLILQDEIIKFEDVSAYTFNEGRLESIMDEETRLIGSSIIDAVSENFAEAFDLANDIANR
jgi:predicted ATP-dependent endonuclease of OLD family